MPTPLLHRFLTLLLLPVFAFGFAACDSNDDDDDLNVQLRDIVELAQDTPSLSILVDALVEADLVSTLQGDGPFTVFAPDNAAFQALLNDLDVTAEELLARDDLAQILTYHVVPTAALSTDLSDGQMLTTVEGSTLEVDINGQTISLIGETNTVTVTMADIEADNGVVHIINGVLLPGDDAGPTQNIVELAQATPTLSTLVDAVVAADLAGTLSGPGPFTVFAPDNDAFADLLAALGITAEELLARDDLAQILTYHVVPTEAFSGDLSDGQTLTTVEGSTLEVDINGSTISLIGETNTVTVTMADVAATNGVVHVIDSVLIPGGN